jgi:hypothetical protein
MGETSSKEHWEQVYATQPEQQLSWFEPVPPISLDLLLVPSLKKDAPVIDVGGGASRLVDALLDRGFTQITVLDIADTALEISRRRLADRAAQVGWRAADVLTWKPDRSYRAWHDRAVFHFLTTAQQRLAYRTTMENAVLSGGIVVIGTFSPLGPERCSGLPVQRYTAQSLSSELGNQFRWTATEKIEHTTPSGQTQQFQFSRFIRN